MPRILLCLILLLILFIAGCSDREPAPTLVVHCHGGVCDFVNHRGQITHTSRDINEFRAAINKPAIQKLIIGSRVVLRFAGVRDGSGLAVPDEVIPVMGELAEAGVVRQDFEYTND